MVVLKGIFAVGVLKYLFDTNKHINLNRVDIFGGTSVGSFIALALSLGFTKEELIEFTENVNFDTLLDSSWMYWYSFYRLLFYKYLFDDTGRENIVKRIFEMKINTIRKYLALSDNFKTCDLTFENLKKLILLQPDIYKHIIINTLDINTGEEIFFTTMNSNRIILD